MLLELSLVSSPVIFTFSGKETMSLCFPKGMEDYCWKDVMLDADPERPNGGKDEGFGSFFNYQVHPRIPHYALMGR